MNDSGSDANLDWFQALSPARLPPEPAGEPVRSVSPGAATNAGTAANLFEQRVEASVGADREHMDGAGSDASMAAYAFEQRVTQEQGTH